jgi:hypothetical protein
MSGCAMIRGSSATFGMQTAGGATGEAFVVGVNAAILDDNPVPNRQNINYRPQQD